MASSRGGRSTTLMPQTKRPDLNVEPTTVDFLDIEANMKYIQTIVVHNLSAGVKRIRAKLKPPEDKDHKPSVSRISEFRLVTENLVAVAPGLSVSIEVEFLTRKPCDYEETLIITAEDFTFEVPLRAKAPCAVISFKDLIDFGTVVTKRTHQIELVMKNDGSRPGTFDIVTTLRGLKFIPQTAKLGPGEHQRVRVELAMESPTTVLEIVEVRMTGVNASGEPATKHISVNAICVHQALHIIFNKQEVDSLDFESLYHGQSKVLDVVLMNDGPTACSFSTQIQEENQAMDRRMVASSPSELVSKDAQPLTVIPFTGQVPAFGSVPLKFTFSPSVLTEDKGFICNRHPENHVSRYEYSGKIDSEELGLSLPIRLFGEALLPSLKVSPEMLMFGHCPVNQRRDIVMTIKNWSEKMSLDFTIPRVPHMTIQPMSGKLAPMQPQNIIVSFMPKALGKFNQDLVIRYCQGLYAHTMRCYGEAPVIGEKPIPVKGLERTGRDFDPEHYFVNQENLTLATCPPKNLQSLTKIMKTDLSTNPNSSEALDSIMLDQAEPTPYSLSPSAMQEYVRNRQKYNRHLKQSRFARKAAERQGGSEGVIDIFFEDDVNMGMVPGSGLKSPRYCVDDIQVEKLSLLRAVDDDTGARGVTGHRYIHDENKPIKKKFKEAPTTQAEVRDCSGTLETWQLGLVSVGPRVLDFGNIYVKSQVSKSFSVFNDLPQAILVAMQYEGLEELTRSKPTSQVIPSAQVAGFDVTLCSSIAQSFQRQVVYTINGIHAFKLLIKAEITPVQIKLSKTELHFRFSDENLDRNLTEQIILTNPGNAPAHFEWKGATANFNVNPVSGVIRPGAAIPVEAIFTPPNTGQALDATITLKVMDGDDSLALRCTGQVPESSCSFGVRKLDLGVMAVGLPSDRSVPVVNTGKSFAVFHVEPLVEGVTVTPMRGRVQPDGRADLDVRVSLDKAGQLESVLQLNVRGGKPIKLPILATAVVPNIEFVEQEIEFGQLTLGATSTVPLSLKNSSAVEGTLYVNLQPYPEFKLSLLEEREVKDDDDGGDATALQPMTVQQYQAAIGGAQDAARGSIATSQVQSPDEEDEEANSQIYKIIVQPNYSLQLQLTYEPVELGQHFFEFPIVAAGGNKTEGLRKVVHAEALRPRMLFSTTIMDFQKKVVASGSAPVASVLELALHNADDTPIEWRIDTEPLKKYLQTFTIEPCSGTLAPEQDCLVRAAFIPSEPIEYKASLNVYISPPRAQQDKTSAPAGVAASIPEGVQALPPDETKPYLQLRFKGLGAVPKLSFDRREIVLPTVPLGIRSRCLFYLQNEGYDSLDVKFRLPTDNIRIPLTINFPEGQQLGLTKPRIPVEVVFQSARPISFCAKIEFLDNDTGSYVLPVCGTTENCLLTCHQYLTHNVDFYTMEGDPVTLTEKEDSAGAETGPAPSVKTGSVSHQSVAGFGGQDTSQVEFLVRWMNGNVLKNQLDHFPQDLISAGGRHLYEMIEFLSGKQVPQSKQGAGGRMDNTANSFRSNDKGRQKGNREMTRIQTLMQQYEQLLNFLKQHGALLSCVRPEHFLSCDLYVAYQHSLNPGLSRRHCEKSFYPKSMEAWLSSTLQTIKIFLLNRITQKAFKTLPGMTEQIDQPVAAPVGDEGADKEHATDLKRTCQELQQAVEVRGLGDSNVYSLSESILLRWLNFHFWRGNRDRSRYSARKVLCFDTDLEDSIVLAVVIQSHVPNCQAVQNMRVPCTTLDHYEENASHIMAALHEIGLSFPIQASDIASPQAKDMLLFVMFLFQNLPHYVPKTVIVFSTLLGVNMTKNIELTNPSKKPITYSVKVQGAPDFTIKEDVVKIEPKQTVAFPVEFQSRFSRMVEAQIMFTSRREGTAHAASMVFKLRSRCAGRKPRKTMQVAAVCYEVGTVDIEVENPFSEDAEFQLALRESTLCDAERNPLKSKRAEVAEPFYLHQKFLRVKAGTTQKLTVSFLPFEAPAHFTALLSVYDPKAGEFYYELFGTSSPPVPIESFKVQVKAEEFGTKELILPHQNSQWNRARGWADSHGSGVKTTYPETITYDVKLSSPFWTAPKQVTVTSAAASKAVVDPKSESKSGTKGKEAIDRRPSADPQGPAQGGKSLALGPAANAKLSLEFKPKEPGLYPCTVTLTSDVDIRIYQLEGTGTAPNTHCSLSFTTQARKHLTQEIPVVNPTDREWSIKAVLSQTGHEFEGPREFIAKKRQANGQATVSYYPLSFKPEWVCNVQGQLTLQNTGTNETYEYVLHGVSEEPLAEEHVVIKCEAREKTSHTFLVKNHSNNPATFEVESDLVHISGPSSIQVEARGTANYELTFQPLQAGQVTGCIMFRDTTGHFTWYTVELMTLPPKPQQTLPLTCVVRQAVAVDIQLVNPLDDVVVFEVGLNGEGLLGEAEFVLAPKETATYELVYSPLLPSHTKGTAVFFNDIVGEFWYDLDLIAESAPPEELPPLECELGRTVQTQVKIDNPTGQEVVLKHRISNKINFKVLQSRVVLPPLDSATITIEYSPSSLQNVEEAMIVFEHSAVGQWQFKVQGTGLPPVEARTVTVVAQVNHPVSSTLSFKNPFLETIHAFIILEAKNEKGVFSLLNKKAKVQIGPLASTQIPFSFCPPTMTQHSAELCVSVAKPSLTWTYKIQGVAEAPPDPTLHTFTIQAREQLETFYPLTLVGFESTPGGRHGDALACELQVPQQYQALVAKVFDVSLSPQGGSSPAPSSLPRASSPAGGSQVFLKVRFAPLRPFVANCTLVITRASGGRWRFNVKLEATEPDVDDTIMIQSPLNKPASVAFRLSNHTSAYAEFDAFFDAESAYEFTVQPTSGVLEPAGTSGTTFVVTYKPTEYGKPVQGKLIIQTEDVYWSYQVKGTHPKYTAPVVDKPTVMTRLSKDIQQEMAKASSQRKRKNFIRDNMGRGAKILAE